MDIQQSDLVNLEEELAVYLQQIRTELEVLDLDKIITKLQQLKPNQALVTKLLNGLKFSTDTHPTPKLRKYRIFVTDVLEYDLYAAAYNLEDGIQGVSPFGQGLNIGYEPILMDRCSVLATILQPDNNFNRTSNHLVIRSYQYDSDGSPIPPKLYTILTVIGWLQEDGEFHMLFSENQPIPTAEVHKHQELQQYLRNLLRGDELATEWVLMNLMSQVQFRQSGEVGGRVVLNICNSDSSLKEGLACIHHPTQVIDLSIENLSQRRWYSSKNLDSNMLDQGTLVFPINTPTLFLIDETLMTPGKLGDLGVRNIKYLQTVIEQSIMEVDYTYQSVTLQADVNAIILSEGRSFIPHNVEVYWEPNEAQQAPQPPIDVEEYIRNIRLRTNSIDIGPLGEQIADRYAELRKTNQEVEPETLVLLVALMKIYAAIDGEVIATIDHFTKSTKLWLANQARINKYKQKK